MKNPVRNLVAVTAGDAAMVSAARAAVLEVARAKNAEDLGEDAAGRIVFTVPWEPCFKEVRELSAKFPAATFTLLGDAFAKSHWVSKSVYTGGKVIEDVTLSRIDGDHFQRVHAEIFGNPQSSPAA